jgi:superfamily II DNA or RNA helicase
MTAVPAGVQAAGSGQAAVTNGSGPDVPEAGQLVRVRGQQWVVSGISRSRQPDDELAATRVPGRTLVTLTSVSDDDLGEELTVVWEVEPGREIVPATRLPQVTETNWDDPQVLGAFLDAVRWGTVASADARTLQAPFRSGIVIEEYQLEPVARALAMPRVNLLIADDVGLGKTIEAGLVVQEMLLRHRARRVIVVCPASLTLKWREEMAAKFGLGFQVLDAAQLRELRRSHGLEANPFGVYPRVIISLQWLRTPRVQRMLDEVLTNDTRFPGFFDLLIVDEVHHCAPAVPPKEHGYPVESKQASAVRRLSEHSQHRLFLSATPHNGYPWSWQALLEMLDPRRFVKGHEPDRQALEQVMVRRLKSDIKNPDGTGRFPGRRIRAIDIAYTAEEQQGHALLQQYAAARRARPGDAAARAGDLVTLILKKRLFSSPAAFALTLESHLASEDQDHYPERSVATAASAPDIAWMDEVLAWDDEPSDDDPGSDAERAAFGRIAALPGVAGGAAGSPAEAACRRQLALWAERHAEPADSKALALVAELNAICRPGGDWARGERVIVFTEYKATQQWLAGILTARGLGGERLGLLSGGMDDSKREHLKAAFQASPDRDPIRILLATDAASEGIDLQRYCRRVIHYDIPFNPNRLEQRIGRVDRHGQARQVEVCHFVGAGWESEPEGSYAGDLEYLARVARKVATEREDLGSVNPVLARAVEARMLGRPVLIDPLQVTPKASVSLLRAERDLREQVRRLRDQLDASVAALHVAPANVRRVVDTALRLADQPPLAPAGDGLIAPPALRAGWERTVTGLADPLDGRPRPLTFDAAIAAGRDDVVLAHLEYPLVAQSTRLLRSAIWGGRAALRRVAAVRFAPPPEAGVNGPLVAVFARLVLVGADGRRLHEEIILSGRIVPPTGRSRRVELEEARHEALHASVEAALEPGACRLAPRAAREDFARRWGELEPLLAGDVRLRAQERKARLQRQLDASEAKETRDVEAVFAQLKANLDAALAGPGAVQLTLGQLDELDEMEKHQFERDREAWRARRDGIEDEKRRELDAIRRRYGGVRELVFPFAIALCVPGDDAVPETGGGER